MQNNLIETIRMTVLSRRIEFKDFAKSVSVNPHTITNIFAGTNSPKLQTFLKMLEVLQIQIQFKTDLDILEAWKQALENAKSKEQSILFLWKNIALQVFTGQNESQIVADLSRKLGKKRQHIRYYWKSLSYPRLDSLIALFAAVNVEIELRTEENKLPTLLDKPKNLN